MQRNSIIYFNIQLYRLAMNILYLGKYRKRFAYITKLIRSKTVLELCFADTIIAAHCKQKSVDWLGIDINSHFVQRAIRKGYQARQINIKYIESLPNADNIVIVGSLYHFHNHLEQLFSKMLHASSHIIISEPVINLTGRKGIIGNLAKRMATVCGTPQSYRFTKQELLQVLLTMSFKLKFNYQVMNEFSKDIIIVLTK